MAKLPGDKNKIFSLTITFIYRLDKKEYLHLSRGKRNLKVSSHTQSELTKQVQHESQQKNIIK
jgi:hypothetical protein